MAETRHHSSTNEFQGSAAPFDVWSMRANRRFSLRDICQITHDATVTFRYFRKFRKAVGEKRTSRIMLAVTEVNGCALCAYGHAKFALDAGIDPGEVRDLLGGVTQGAPDRELAGIGFAQHYADTEGHPDEDAWDQLVQFYGREEALGVLGATRMMMWGNAVGIPLSSLRARLKGSPHPGSSVTYEIGTILGAWVVVPVAVIRALFSLARHQPPITFHRG
ncbi:carboxymuconolactone decarboxylase family protein [Salinibacterium sp. SWN139]|uniref:carboxymuconolactone decarboxylase family protein n=1 Tax=Salinibacterium sp. SWN139 TaxID=2792055 RepID=UPI0018CE6A29|nr:carboxymuconolactone decarboxylase family protein [Salinibacterium sp. SWN139]MBH0054270.1 carboxymuconolactone decarboxylase family protein [Salinibacterium sp. SWN139]